MIIIIDGYNVLKHMFSGKKDIPSKQRNHFIKQLALYKTTLEKKPQIIIVFDAGPSTHATREITNDIVVIYSGTKMSADDWILAWIERNKGNEILVITLDRALREHCQKMNADWLSPSDFYTLIHTNLVNKTIKNDNKTSQSLKKYNTQDLADINSLEDELIDSYKLDLLMEQASLTVRPKTEDLTIKKQPESKAHKLSKQERRLQAKIKKL